MKDATAGPLAEPVAPGTRGGIAARIVSGVIALPPVLAAIYFGAWSFAALIGLGGAVLWWEWCHLCGRSVRAPASMVGAAFVIAAIAATVWGDVRAGLSTATAGGAVALVWALAAAERDGGGRSARTGSGSPWIAFGVLYIGLPTVLLVWLRDDLGRATVYWLFVLVWATDTGAYAFGRLIGGPKLAPRISPNKTWAGLGGGMACAAVVGLGFGMMPETAAPVRLALLSAVLAVVAQIGDLFESWVKRHFGVKDAGGIMPGHGGLLDRVDGLLAVAVAAAFVAMIDRERVLVWL